MKKELLEKIKNILAEEFMKRDEKLISYFIYNLLKIITDIDEKCDSEEDLEPLLNKLEMLDFFMNCEELKFTKKGSITKKNNVSEYANFSGKYKGKPFTGRYDINQGLD